MKQKYIVELITGPIYEASYMTIYRKGNFTELLDQLSGMLMIVYKFANCTKLCFLL